MRNKKKLKRKCWNTEKNDFPFYFVDLSGLLLQKETMNITVCSKMSKTKKEGNAEPLTEMNTFSVLSFQEMAEVESKTSGL